MSLTATGGNAYQWSANAGGVVSASAVVTPAITTNYSVTVTTTTTIGCSASTSVTATFVPPMAAQAISTTQTAVLGSGNCTAAIQQTGTGRRFGSEAWDTRG